MSSRGRGSRLRFDTNPRGGDRIDPPPALSRQIRFSSIALAVLVCAMVWRMGPELLDDGAFFLRYAENFAAGRFWVWNPGEAPVWGASSPLWPALLSLPISMGLPEVASASWMGICLGAIGLACCATVLYARLGIVAGAGMLSFCAIDTGLTYYCSSGMETPLTLLMLAAAVCVILVGSPAWIVGCVAGLLAIQKIDLVPAGLLLLASDWLRTRRVPGMAIAIAAGIALAWYGFAWWYFGSPIPNSFRTKFLFQEDFHRTIDWKWFGSSVLFRGTHRVFTALAAAALLWTTPERRRLLVLTLGLPAIHLIAYSVEFPFESYAWYCIPSVFCLATTAAVGISGLSDPAIRPQANPRWRLARSLAGPLLIPFVVASGWHGEWRSTAAVKEYSRIQEFDRAEAGRWVRQHTPESFVVYTAWGNPAFHSKRRVIDGSFLNRPFETGNLIAKYRPEILIHSGNPGSTPQRPAFGIPFSGYTVVQIFDRAYSLGMQDYFAVLVRDDVLGVATGGSRAPAARRVSPR